MTVTMKRTALVTGSSGGLGRAICDRLREDGFTVLGLDLTEDADLQVDVTGELADPRLSDVDVVVSNAAILTTVAEVHDMTREQWDRDIAVNLTGAFNVIQACLGGMRERRYGRVVAISSTAGVLGVRMQAAYAASKAGLLGLIKSVALDEASHNITANAVLPGVIARAGESTDLAPGLADAIPAGRLARNEEITGLISFLVSEDAGYVTGQQVAVDGGLCLSPMGLHAPAPTPPAAKR